MKHAKTSLDSRISNNQEQRPLPHLPNSKPSQYVDSQEKTTQNNEDEHCTAGVESNASQDLLKRKFEEYKLKNGGKLKRDEGKAMVENGFFIKNNNGTYRVGFYGWDAISASVKQVFKNIDNVSFLNVLAPHSPEESLHKVNGFDVDSCDSNYLSLERAIYSKAANLQDGQRHVVIASIPTKNKGENGTEIGEKYISAVVTKSKRTGPSIYFLSGLSNIQEDLLSINKNALEDDFYYNNNEEYRQINYLDSTHELTYNNDSSGIAAVIGASALSEALMLERFPSDLVKFGNLIYEENKLYSRVVKEFLLPPQISKYIEDDMTDKDVFEDVTTYMPSDLNNDDTTTLKQFIDANTIGMQNESLQNKAALVLDNVMSKAEPSQCKKQLFTAPRPLPNLPNNKSQDVKNAKEVEDVEGDSPEFSQAIHELKSSNSNRGFHFKAVIGIDRVKKSILFGSAANDLTIDPIKDAVKSNDRSILDCPVENDTQYAEISSALFMRRRSESDVSSAKFRFSLESPYARELKNMDKKEINKATSAAEAELRHRVDDYEKYHMCKSFSDPKSKSVQNNFAKNLKEYKSRAHLFSYHPEIKSDNDYRIAKMAQIASNTKLAKSNISPIADAIYRLKIESGLGSDRIIALSSKIEEYESGGLYKIKSKIDRDNERISDYNALECENNAAIQLRQEKEMNDRIEKYKRIACNAFSRNVVKKNPLVLKTKIPELEDDEQMDRAYKALGHRFDAANKSDFLRKLKSISEDNERADMLSGSFNSGRSAFRKSLKLSRDGESEMRCLPL